MWKSKFDRTQELQTMRTTHHQWTEQSLTCVIYHTRSYWLLWLSSISPVCYITTMRTTHHQCTERSLTCVIYHTSPVDWAKSHMCNQSLTCVINHTSEVDSAESHLCIIYHTRSYWLLCTVCCKLLDGKIYIIHFHHVLEHIWIQCIALYLP